MAAFKPKGGIFDCCGHKPKGGNKDAIFAKSNVQQKANAGDEASDGPPPSAYKQLDDLQAMEIYALKEKANQAQYVAALNKKLKEQCDKLHHQLKNVKSQLAEEQALRAQSTSPKSRSSSSSEFLPPHSPISVSSQRTDDVLSHLDDEEANGSGEPSGKTATEALQSGISAFRGGDYQTAGRLFQESIRLAHRTKNLRVEARASGNLSNVFSAMKEPHRALYFFKHSLKILRKLKETKLESYVLENGVMCCMQLSLYDEALGLALRKMALSEGDAAEQKKAASWIDKINRALNGEFDIEIDTKVAVSSLGGGRTDEGEANTMEEDPSVDTVESIKEQIIHIYKAHNPAKIPDVDSLLAKYSGHEEKLLEAVKEKYGA